MSLKRSEWPAKALGFMSDGIIEVAQDVREICNTAMVPSPDPEAHVRFKDGSSLHCVGSDGDFKSYTLGTSLCVQVAIGLFVDSLRIRILFSMCCIVIAITPPP